MASRVQQCNLAIHGLSSFALLVRNKACNLEDLKILSFWKQKLDCLLQDTNDYIKIVLLRYQHFLNFIFLMLRIKYFFLCRVRVMLLNSRWKYLYNLLRASVWMAHLFCDLCFRTPCEFINCGNCIPSLEEWAPHLLDLVPPSTSWRSCSLLQPRT